MAEKTEKSLEEIEARQKQLVARRERFITNKAQVEAELGARKRQLKELMDKVRKEGMDPNTLPEDIRRMKEVLTTKQDMLEAELAAAEKALQPMIDAIEKP